MVFTYSDGEETYQSEDKATIHVKTVRERLSPFPTVATVSAAVIALISLISTSSAYRPLIEYIPTYFLWLAPFIPAMYLLYSYFGFEILSVVKGVSNGMEEPDYITQPLEEIKPELARIALLVIAKNREFCSYSDVQDVFDYDQTDFEAEMANLENNLLVKKNDRGMYTITKRGGDYLEGRLSPTFLNFS